MPDIHYSYTGDVSSLAKATKDSIKLLDQYASVVERVAKEKFFVNDTEMQRFSKSIRDAIAPTTQLKNEFREMVAHQQRMYGAINAIDRMISVQERSKKSARESAGVFKEAFAAQEAAAKKAAAEQKAAAKEAEKALKQQQKAQQNANKESQKTPSIVKSISQSFKDLKKSTDEVSKSVNNINSGFSKLAGIISGAAIGTMLADAAKESINYVENLNLFKVAMHDSIEEGQAFIATMAEMYGLDPSYLSKTTGLFYEMAYAVDVPADAAAKLSLNLTALSSDLASLFNKDFEQVADNLTSGLRGMSRAVVKYGLDLRASTVEAYANAHGIYEQFETMSEANREILRYLVILEQSSDAQSDFARTIESPANQLRIFKEQVVQLGRAIGNFIVAPIAAALPYITGFVMAIRMILEALAELFGFMSWTSNSTSDFSDSVSDATEGAVSGIGGIGGAASDAKKELDKLIAPFDELNILSENTDLSAGAGGGAGGAGGMGELVDPELLKLLDESKYKLEEVRLKANDVRDAILDFMGIKIWQEFDEATGRMITRLEYMPEVFEKNLINKFPQWEKTIQALFDVDWSYAWNQLKLIADLLGQIASMTLRNLFNDLLAIFGISDESLANSILGINDALLQFRIYLTENKDEIANIITTVIELVAAFSLISGAIGILSPIVSTFMMVFNPLSDLFDILFAAIKPVVTSLGTLGQYMVQTQITGSTMVGTLLSSFGQFSSFFSAVFAGGIVAAVALIIGAFANWVLKTDEGRAFMSEVFTILGSIFRNLGTIFTAVVEGIISAIDWLTENFSFAFEGMGEIITNFLSMLDGLLQFIAGVFTGNWEMALRGLANVFVGMINNLIVAAETGINFIISMVNMVIKKLVDTVLGAVNNIMISIGDLLEWLGIEVDLRFKFDVPQIPLVTLPRVPQFANGGVVTGPTYSLIGEAGRSEAVIPLDNSPQMNEFIERIADRIADVKGDVHVYIGGKEVDAEIYRASKRGEQLVGAQPIRKRG